MRRLGWWLGMGTALWMAPLPAAEVYRHVDRDGVVHYSDTPPSKDARPVALPPIQVIAPPSRAAQADEPAHPAAAAGPRLDIVAPMPGQTFQGDDLRLDVSVQVDRPLPQGHGLLYRVDGDAQNARPTRALNYTLQGLAAGTHRVDVMMVDAAGREVAGAAPVTIHIQPPGSASPPRMR